MTCHSMVLRPGQAEEHCTAALPEVRRNRLHLHPLAAASAPWSALLCLAFFPYLWPKPQTEWCASCLLTANTSCQVPVCFSDGLSSSRLWSVHLTGSVHLTYKSAAECESEIHSRRVRLRCGLPPNAGKSLFWQDSHLLPREGQGSMVGCL